MSPRKGSSALHGSQGGLEYHRKVDFFLQDVLGSVDKTVRWHREACQLRKLDLFLFVKGQVQCLPLRPDQQCFTTNVCVATDPKRLIVQRHNGHWDLRRFTERSNCVYQLFLCPCQVRFRRRHFKNTYEPTVSQGGSPSSSTKSDHFEATVYQTPGDLGRG